MSTIITNEVQLGQDSVTPANNFVIGTPVVPDGTLTFGTGVSGSVTTVSTLYSNSVMSLSGIIATGGELEISGNLSVGSITTTSTGISVDATTANTVTANTVTTDALSANTVTANTVTIGDYVLPTADGSANQIFITDGSGNVSFTDLPAGFTTGKAIAMAIVFG